MRTLLRLTVAGLMASASVVLLPDVAQAYRLASDTLEMSGERVAWRDTISYGANDTPPSGLSLYEYERAVRLAFEAWATVDCASIPFAYRGLHGRDAVSGDGEVTVVVVHAGWAELGFAADAAATTEVVFARSDDLWVISDADIYVNADTFRWAPQHEEDRRDLQATLTHEVGHVLGFLEACELDGEPRCTPEDETATMYPLYQGAEQRRIGEDDAAGLCFLYPRPDECAACVDGETCVDGACVPDCSVDERCGTPCGSDDDCGDGSCGPDGYCQGSAAWGDPCMSDSACLPGVCDEGLCVPACDRVEDCPDELSCEAGACIGRDPYQAPCEEPSTCLGNVCLEVDGDPRCSRECVEGEMCPLGDVCAAVDGLMVCVPPSPGGCAVAGRNPPAPWIFVFLAVAVGLVRRRGIRHE